MEVLSFWQVTYSDPGAFGLCLASVYENFGGKFLSHCELYAEFPSGNSRPFEIDQFASFSDKIWGEGMDPYIPGSDGPA